LAALRDLEAVYRKEIAPTLVLPKGINAPASALLALSNELVRLEGLVADPSDVQAFVDAELGRVLEVQAKLLEGVGSARLEAAEKLHEAYVQALEVALRALAESVAEEQSALRGQVFKALGVARDGKIGADQAALGAVLATRGVTAITITARGAEDAARESAAEQDPKAIERVRAAITP
jgi:hypothetical protein